MLSHVRSGDPTQCSADLAPVPLSRRVQIPRTRTSRMVCVDIVRYSIFQDEEAEAEVLIFPGTKLRVVDCMDMGNDLFMVHLEEMEIPTELIK